ncbi:MAG: hypothetical protein KC619_19945 [Myxococcales bacterium]|nr:hypothetical protein [Myxococcales bacterium]
MRWVSAASALLCLLGCDRHQAWTFHNGAELDEARPPTIVAEVYGGGECGFACQPPGDQVYCEELGRGMQGEPPAGLRTGDRYCFMGTALDETNQAYAIGCAVAVVGGEPIDVALSPIEEGRVIHRRCRQGPSIRFDAGMDGGAVLVDAGGLDAGGLDAGPPLLPDAGPAVDYGRPARVYFNVYGPGAVGVYDADGRLMGGGYLYDRHQLWVDAWVGFYVRIEATPDAGSRLQSITVPECSNTSPCELLFATNQVIDITFGP